MKLLEAGMAIALLGCAGSACGQQRSPPAQSRQDANADAPSAEALQLAQALAVPRILILSRVTPAAAKADLKEKLLFARPAGRGPGCRYSDPPCAAAADRIAGKYAASHAKAMNDAIDRLHARLLEAKMSPDQIRAALAFVRTDAGQAFADSLRDLDSRDAAKLMSSMQSVTFSGSPFEEFFAETKQLPRASLGFAPPPIPPPPPARRER